MRIAEPRRLRRHALGDVDGGQRLELIVEPERRVDARRLLVGGRILHVKRVAGLDLDRARRGRGSDDTSTDDPVLQRLPELHRDPEVGIEVKALPCGHARVRLDVHRDVVEVDPGESVEAGEVRRVELQRHLDTRHHRGDSREVQRHLRELVAALALQAASVRRENGRGGDVRRLEPSADRDQQPARLLERVARTDCEDVELTGVDVHAREDVEVLAVEDAQARAGVGAEGQVSVEAPLVLRRGRIHAPAAVGCVRGLDRDRVAGAEGVRVRKDHRRSDRISHVDRAGILDV
jgi:hypothetical protein